MVNDTATNNAIEVVHGKAMQFQHPGLKHRAGAPLFKYLFQGSDSSLSNYNLTIAQQTSFSSPRHRHNFEQFRLPLSGDFSFGTDPELILHEGELGYFPEGTYYGPQSDDNSTKEILVLQFGGPCKQGYFSYQKLAEVQKELEAEGRFEGGKFYRHGAATTNGKVDDGTKQSEAKDGFEALWEKTTGRKLVYPEGRYANPVFMRLDAFRWKVVGKGAYRKILGVFTERETVVEMLKLESGGEVQLQPRQNAVQLFYVLRGEGQINEQRWEEQSALRLQPGQSAWLSTATVVEVLRIELPNLED